MLGLEVRVGVGLGLGSYIPISYCIQSVYNYNRLLVTTCGTAGHLYLPQGRDYDTLVARGSVSFALFPLVFILREAKRTSGGTRYKSLFHADVAV
jgi:hypothetical protein